VQFVYIKLTSHHVDVIYSFYSFIMSQSREKKTKRHRTNYIHTTSLNNLTTRRI